MCRYVLETFVVLTIEINRQVVHIQTNFQDTFLVKGDNKSLRKAYSRRIS